MIIEYMWANVLNIACFDINAKDEEIINAISDSIRNGSIARGEIIVYAKSRTEETKSKIGNVLWVLLMLSLVAPIIKQALVNRRLNEAAASGK